MKRVDGHSPNGGEPMPEASPPVPPLLDARQPMPAVGSAASARFPFLCHICGNPVDPTAFPMRDAIDFNLANEIILARRCLHCFLRQALLTEGGDPL